MKKHVPILRPVVFVVFLVFLASSVFSANPYDDSAQILITPATTSVTNGEIRGIEFSKESPDSRAKSEAQEAYYHVYLDIQGCLDRLDRQVWRGDWESALAAIAFINKRFQKYPNIRKDLGWRLESAKALLYPTNATDLLEKKLRRLEFYLEKNDLESAANAVAHLDKECKKAPQSANSTKASYKSLRLATLAKLVAAVKHGFGRIDEKERDKASSADIMASVRWTSQWVDLLRKIGSPSSKDFIAASQKRLVKLQNTFPVSNVKVPYLSQANNAISPGSTCQNTSIAMMLRAYGWSGTPDDITSVFGRFFAQTPAGGAEVFNYFAEKAGLSIRARGGVVSYREFHQKLAKGPMIAYGYFTRDGHVVVVNGFDGQNYDVNDPGGLWNQVPYGSVDFTNGSHQKYPKGAFDEAVAYDGTVWCLEFVSQTTY
jgi:hypothetical protein